MNIRLRYMDLMYAAVIGNGLTLIDVTQVGWALIVSLILLVTIFEDLYLYYMDANTGDESQQTNIVMTVCEISILTAWYFSMTAYSQHSHNVFLFFGLFLALKTLAGYILCVESRRFQFARVLQESIFLTGAGFSLLIYFSPPEIHQLFTLRSMLTACLIIWFLQSTVWWMMQGLAAAPEANDNA